MNEHAKYHITQSNLRKLVYRSGVVERDLSNLYEIIQDFKLRDLLSSTEMRNLGSLSSFLLKSEAYLLDLAKQSKASSSVANQASSMIFVSGAPKYHKDNTCKTLTKDFENFEIPVEILQRGDSAVRDFREFATINRKLLNEGKEDIFRLRLKSQFHLTSDIGKVSFTNSGRAPLPVSSFGTDLNQLAAAIVTAAARVESLRETEEGAKALQNYRFASPSRLTQGGELNACERQVLERKRDLIALVTEYVVRKHNGDGTVFSQQLLEVYGFEPCGICCANDSHLDFSHL